MPIINSLLDNDLYKFTMMQAVHHNFPTAQAEYKFVLRSKDVDLNPYRQRIIDEIEHMCTLNFKSDELDYLRSLPFVKSDFVDFLEYFRLNTRGFEFSSPDEEFGFRFKGSWVHKILFEVPLMSVISEVYLADKIQKQDAFEIGMGRLKEKYGMIKSVPFNVNFADFGTRRRYSREWQEKVVGWLSANLPYGFVGTSNLSFAKQNNIKPIGTMAHEWIQAGQALGKVQLKNSQQYMFETWVKEYRGDLGIALTDTIGMSAFLKDFDKYFAKLYDGCRHDSANPFTWCDKLIAHYKELGIDARTKTAVFSDGLDIPKMLKIADHYDGKIKTSFGIGTNLTNDVGVKPLSMVIKLVRLNDNPVAKISDEPQKAICEDPEFLSYLKKVYGV